MPAKILLIPLFEYYLFILCSISDLRLDTLSQILTLSNVRAHCRMLVVESCQGMVVGALLDRMGGRHIFAN